MIDVYVTGTGIPALVAALDLAELGLSVRVCSDRSEQDLPGGPVPDADGTLRALMDRLAAPLSAAVGENVGVRPLSFPPQPRLIRGARGDWVLQPRPSVSGVPAVPMSEESIAALGGGASFRAYLDRVRPLLTIGKTRELGKLVRSRMGRQVATTLVAPEVRERFGVGEDSVEVAVAAPGLNEALSRAGSLSGAALACADRNVARETRVMPADGWRVLREALVERLSLYAVEFGEGLSSVERAPSSGPASQEAEAAEWIIQQGEERIVARAVVVDRGGGRRDEAPGLPVLTGAPAAEREYVSARIEAPQWWPDENEAADALRLLRASNGEIWSLRVAREGGRWWAHLASPARPAGRGTATTDVDATAIGADAAAAGANGDQRSSAPHGVSAELADLCEEADIELSSGAGATVLHRFRAAPYATVEQRERGQAALAGLHDEHPEVLLTGASLHGDDLAAAVSAAQERAVLIRRRLAGISE